MLSTLSPAPVVSMEDGELPFGGDHTLSCLYVVVAERDDVAAFFAGHDGCGETVRWDWEADRDAGTARVGLELGHACGRPAGLRLELDVDADRQRLCRLMQTGALVVSDRPWGELPQRVVAYAVAAEHVEAAVRRAQAGLQELRTKLN